MMTALRKLHGFLLWVAQMCSTMLSCIHKTHKSYWNSNAIKQEERKFNSTPPVLTRESRPKEISWKVHGTAPTLYD